jgi:uncharacterized protein (TIGR03000 family)
VLKNKGGTTMFRRIFAMSVLGCLLAAGPAAAQDRWYAVWAHRGGYSAAHRHWQRGSAPDWGQWYGGYPYYDNLSDFSRYTDPYDSGYGGRVNPDFTVTRDSAFQTPLISMQTAATGTATVEVRVPSAQAQVSFDGHETVARGTQRRYETPALQVDQNYHYNVTATWMENGRRVTRDLPVSVNAGRLAVADFTRPVLAATESR